MRAVFLCVLLAWMGVGSPGPARAQPVPAALQQAFDSLRQTDPPQATALAAALVGPDGQVQTVLLGHDRVGGAPLAPDARFEWGSVSKALTGSLLARLARDGRVGLDDPLARWLPELQGTPAGRITLRQLATHTAGLPRLPMHWRTWVSLLRDPGDPYRHASREDLLAYLSGWDGQAPAEFAYSNLGFAVLGMALEAAAGEPLEPLMQREILSPAGAAGARFSDVGLAAQVTGHDGRGRPTPAWHLGPYAGAGALRADVAALAALLQAARRQAPPFDAGAQALQQPRGADGAGVGLGWLRTERHGDAIVWHNGGTGGFRSFVGYSERSGRAVALVANGAGASLDALGMHLLQPAFALSPAAAAGPAGPVPSWAWPLLALLGLAGLAWRAWRPASRAEQGLELAACAAVLALAAVRWPAGPGVAAAWAVAAVALAALLLRRGRGSPVWPARRGRFALSASASALGLWVLWRVS